MEMETRNVAKVVLIERPQAGVLGHRTGRDGYVKLTTPGSPYFLIHIRRDARLRFPEARDHVRSQEHRHERGDGGNLRFQILDFRFQIAFLTSSRRDMKSSI